jgi:hypothetical protein
MANIRPLTLEERTALEAVAVTADSEIDTSDVPEVTDWIGPSRRTLSSCEAPYVSAVRRGPVGVAQTRWRELPYPDRCRAA